MYGGGIFQIPRRKLTCKHSTPSATVSGNDTMVSTQNTLILPPYCPEFLYSPTETYWKIPLGWNSGGYVPVIIYSEYDIVMKMRRCVRWKIYFRVKQRCAVAIVLGSIKL